MNHKNIQKAVESLRKIVLTQQEKKALYARLEKYVDSHREAMPIVSPFYSDTVTVPYMRMYKVFLSCAALSMIAIIVLGSTTVIASANTLPGDVLYPVKVRVSEPLMLLLAMTSESHQRIQISQIEERLREVETLARENRLAPTTVAMAKALVGDEVIDLRDKLSRKSWEDLRGRLSARSGIFEYMGDRSFE